MMREPPTCSRIIRARVNDKNRVARLPQPSLSGLANEMPKRKQAASEVPTATEGTAHLKLIVGAKIQALDKKQRSCAALVIRMRGEGDHSQVRIHFVGFKKNEDEWIAATSERLSAYIQVEEPPTRPTEWYQHGHVGDDEWLVESLLKKRRRGGKTQYLVKWDSWDASHNSWEPPRNIDRNEILAFERALAGTLSTGAVKVKKVSAPRPESRPFVVVQSETASAAFKAEMSNLVKDWYMPVLGRAIDATIKHTGIQWFNKLIIQTWIAPAMFVALHDLFRIWAKELPGDDPGLHVSGILSVRGGEGGRNVEDAFTISHPKILSKILGDREPIFERKQNLAIIYLAPGATLSYRTERGADGEHVKSELIFKAQVIKLTLDTNDDSKAVFGFDRKRGRNKKKPEDLNYTPEYELAQKVALCRRVLAMADALPPTSDPTHALPLPARLRAFCDGVLSAFAVSQAAS